MYFYIFDPGRDKEAKYFERIQGRLLNLLAEHRIDGETYRVTAIRTVELLVEQAFGLSAKTIVVVGSDASLNRTINAVVKQKPEVTLGFIPLDPGSALGRILGMAAEIGEAVKTLAGRLVRELTLGRVGEHYFLSQVDLGQGGSPKAPAGFWGWGTMRSFLQLQPFPLQLSLEDSYTATSEVLAAQIINCRNNEGCRFKLGDPTDKFLDILLLNRLTATQVFRHRQALARGCLDNVPGATVMHAKKIEILGPKKLPLLVEGQVYAKAPATITIAKEKIKIIVGKNRQF